MSFRPNIISGIEFPLKKEKFTDANSYTLGTSRATITSFTLTPRSGYLIRILAVYIRFSISGNAGATTHGSNYKRLKVPNRVFRQSIMGL